VSRNCTTNITAAREVAANNFAGKRLGRRRELRLRKCTAAKRVVDEGVVTTERLLFLLNLYKQIDAAYIHGNKRQPNNAQKTNSAYAP
jgi:hypothetical protein